MGKARLLIVDDEESIRLLYQQEFTDEGYDVALASSGEEALEVLDKEPVDLVILDIRMKEMSGLEALQHIVKEKKNLPVILCSAYSSYQDDFSSWLADAYVIKSSDLTELKEEVKRLLEKYYGGDKA
ncbi:MAG TPA: response regulator [Thermosulfidibacter takaii]|uniref:Response regulator n=1 Tax=Thermosulfidibacter takaii TaxID=412593 RepID=A0A7C0Y9B7_9BACT|nr:response regulator [Thermosulfidibacter takaii]